MDSSLLDGDPNSSLADKLSDLSDLVSPLGQPARERLELSPVEHTRLDPSDSGRLRDRVERAADELEAESKQTQRR